MADRGQHRQAAGTITDSVKSVLPDRGPTKSQAVAVATLFPTGGILLTLSGLALAASVIGFGLLIPVFLLFSPVLVPAVLLMGLAVTGFLTSGALGLGGLSSLVWFARAARDLVTEAAGTVGQKTKETKETGQHRQAGTVGQKETGQHRQTVGTITDSLKSVLPDRAPTKSQALAVAILFPTGGVLLTLSGLALAASVIGFSLLIPVFLLFSPVIVPAVLLMGLAVTGFLTSGALGLGGLSSLAWFARAAKDLVTEATGTVGQKTKETGKEIESKAQEAAGKTDK